MNRRYAITRGPEILRVVDCPPALAEQQCGEGEIAVEVAAGVDDQGWMLRRGRAVRRPAAVSPTGWNTAQGRALKRRRNSLVTEWLWSVDPLTSPLTEDCRAEAADYIARLHRLTVDFPDPAAVVWPLAPALRYATS